MTHSSLDSRPVTSQPESERQRLAALRSYRILDTPREAEFDDIVAIAAQICGVPLSLISLIDEGRQWFKAALGTQATETPRNIAFCAQAIEQHDVLEVPDASQDRRFATNPLVTGGEHLRFYAGAPLRTRDGHNLGTLCVLDTKPGSLSSGQRSALQALARQVMAQLELRHSLARQKEQDERHRLILDSAIDYAIISIDLAGCVTSWNEGARRILGWTQEEMCGRRCDDFFTAEDRANGVPEREMGAALTHGRGNDERWHLRKDGSCFWASGEMMPLKDDGGQPVGLIKILRDRTAGRMLEQQRAAFLQISDRLRDTHSVSDLMFDAARVVGQTLEVSRVGYATVTSDGQWLQVERDWTSPGTPSVAGTHPWQGWGTGHETLSSGAPRVVSQSVAGEQTSGTSWPRQGVPASIDIPLIEDERLVGLFFVHSPTDRLWNASEINFVRDVAERIQLASARRGAEAALRDFAQSLERQVEERVRERNRLWSSTNDLMGTVALKDGHVQEINPAWEKLLGRSDTETSTGTLVDLIEPADRGLVRTMLEQVASGRRVVDVSARLSVASGPPRAVVWNAVPDGALCYVVGHDVTVQREAELRLRQSQKMDAIGQLTGGIAHDFNNLLAGIMGSVDVIRLRLKAGQLQGLDRFVDAASRSARRAAALTQRLLAFSRLQPLESAAADVNQLVLGMADLLRRTLGEDIDLGTSLDAATWQALTDANQLENAILNLVINARDAMPHGGKLTVETRNVYLDETYAALNEEVRSGEYVVIGVSDTGTGMPPEVAARAFDPFFTTKAVGQGTGLGLSMIYGFAKQSAGHVKIYTEVDRGTTVKLYLPRAVVQETRAAPTEPKPVALGRGEMVLVVEDDSTVRLLIIEVLKELGYRHAEAWDPKSALKILNSDLPLDLLITDVGLPQMDGRQLATLARAKRPNLKVLYMTGYAENAAVRSGFVAEGAELLSKPFALDELAAKIRSMLGESV